MLSSDTGTLSAIGCLVRAYCTANAKVEAFIATVVQVVYGNVITSDLQLMISFLTHSHYLCEHHIELIFHDRHILYCISCSL